jgi:CubicO group peptidase (beta-lactamase class C family)
MHAFKSLTAAMLLAMAALTLSACGPAAAWSAVNGPGGQPDFNVIDAYLQTEVNDLRIPGAAVGIVHRGQIVHLQGFGSAGPTGGPVTPQTPFVIGSVAKSFTALAVMQLVEAGRVELDAPVQRYLPWFRVTDPGDSRAITVRQLLNQTSGLSEAAGLQAMYQPARTLEEQVRALANAPLAAPPGKAWAYSNANYQALGLIVEAASGQPYGRYVEQHIFAPLGMAHSFTAPQEAAGLASGHQYWFGIPRAESPEYRSDFLPAGFLISSVEDMSHYLIAQMNGGRYGAASVLSPAGVQELQRPAVKSTLGGDSYYAMGWHRTTVNGLPIIGHDGATHDMHAIVVMVPGSQWGIVLLTNSESWLYEDLGQPDEIAFNVAAMLTGQSVSRNNGVGPYLLFDLLAAVFTGLQIRILLRLLGGKTRAQPKRPGNRLASAGYFFLAWVWPSLRELTAPLVIVFGLPVTSHAPWSYLIQTDIGAWLAGFCLLLLITYAVRVQQGLARRTDAARRQNEQLAQAA